eukprot:gene28586-37552_t
MGLKMNFFEDAFKFFSNMNREASAKHILISGPDASKKLEVLKAELDGAEDLSAAFSEIASKVSECPSAKRGGNLGTFKPGMMVKEFDEVVFNKEVGKIHGPISTQFGQAPSNLIEEMRSTTRPGKLFSDVSGYGILATLLVIWQLARIGGKFMCCPFRNVQSVHTQNQ